MMDKKSLRLAFKARRQALLDEECRLWADLLCRRIVDMPEWKQAKRVMLYLAMPKEANVDKAIEVALKEGKEVYVPVCLNAHEMTAARLTSLDDVERGVLNIRIPKEGYQTIEAKSLDLVYIPGVAFDTKGGRMGMGAGYYDRFLHEVPSSRCIGVAWDIQVQEEDIPLEPHDQRMGAIVTNYRMEYIKSSRI